MTSEPNEGCNDGYLRFRSYGIRAMEDGIVKPLVSSRTFHAMLKGKLSRSVVLDDIKDRRNELYLLLANLGYRPLQNENDLKYRLNCPVFGIKHSRHEYRSRYCRINKLCPFCYGRTYIRDTYDRASKVCFPGGRADHVGAG